VGQAYLLEAAMEFWGMGNLEESPTKHVPPALIHSQENEKKMEYFQEVVGEFVNEYALPKGEQEISISESDKVR
jgi:hypothetical protein